MHCNSFLNSGLWKLWPAERLTESYSFFCASPLVSRFDVVGYGCMTCIGNSGPLPEPVVEAITQVIAEVPVGLQSSCFFSCNLTKMLVFSGRSMEAGDVV